jgi:cell division protease FtsH
VQFGSVDVLESFLTAEQKAKKINDFSYENDKTGNILYNILVTFGPFILLVLVWVWLMRRMGGGGAGAGTGIFSVGKSKAKMYEKGNDLGITFKDVAGQEGAKQEVQEIVEFLKNPQKYTDLGGKIPKGALLVGPPGTGKTLLAKAVAGEAGVPFFSMSGSDFVEMFVGVGASRVRDVFAQAKQKSPCIIFIDEIDAVGRARSKNPSMGGNDERENTLNALLTEMDGFGTNSGVIVLAATNRVDMLDKALLRAGRFDRQINVDLPDLPERKAIFQVHLRPLKIEKALDIDFLARQTPGFSGADIANVCNEAALIAARHDHKEVVKQDFLDAVDRIVGGLEKKTKVMTQEEKRTIALHEAGHATISWFCRYANPLVKVSIVPRGQALGAAWYMPEERQITTKEQMLDEMCSLLGGRAAEELFTGHISSGAVNDLERATKSAYGMIAYMGMSDKLPNICYYNNTEYQFQKPYSETTAKEIDAEVLKMINDEYARAKKILTEHKEGHNALAELLIKKEVIMASDVEEIFGKRPWLSRSQEIMKENEENAPKLEDMPEEVKQAQLEHERAVAEQETNEN